MICYSHVFVGLTKVNHFSLHLESFEGHGGLVEEMVVRVAVEDVSDLLATIRRQLDVDAVLFEEVGRLEASR